jgi:hypothetical protein
MIKLLALTLLACYTSLAYGINLMPDAINIEMDHISHISQHFGPAPTSYGYSDAALSARWDVGRLHLTVAEGYTLGSCQQPPPFLRCGGLAGPHELFQASVAYNLWSKQ